MVQLRHGPDGSQSRPREVTYENTTQILSVIDNEKHRHSDPNAFTDHSSKDSRDETDGQRVSTKQRKYHAKSFSLSENRVAANLNLFQQNRELWEKRAELQSQQSLTTPRILTRNRIAPDLVMDLPVSNKDSAVHSSRESLNSSDEAASDTASVNDVPIDEQNKKGAEDMTSAERFASQNQCTLKKNERFSSNSTVTSVGEQIDGAKVTKSDFKSSNGQTEKPKAEVKPQEASVLKDFTHHAPPNDTKVTNESQASSTSTTSGKETASIKPTVISKELHKSPIPNRNTQKFVSQFADLKLTGGCLNTTNATPSADSSGGGTSQQQQFTSFKPQVKVKPQILRKPLVLPPTTPEMVRRNQE